MPLDVMKKRTVHVGVDYSQIVDASAYLDTLATERAVIAGDGWFVWGEPVGACGNDDCTFHIQIETSDPVRTLFALLGAGLRLCELGERGWATHDGVVAVITDTHDHDSNVVEVTRAELARGLSTFLAERGQ